jgi:hypothetical protein
LIGLPLKEIERELVLKTLESVDGNRTVAARLLGISLRTLRNKIREYSYKGIEIPASRSRRLYKWGLELELSATVGENSCLGMVLQPENSEPKGPLPSVDAAPPTTGRESHLGAAAVRNDRRVR